jgi:hypothetical protein
MGSLEVGTPPVLAVSSLDNGGVQTLGSNNGQKRKSLGFILDGQNSEHFTFFGSGQPTWLK